MGSSIIIDGIEILIILLIYTTRNIWDWHLGIIIYLLVLPLMPEGYWRYLFKVHQENEFGRISEKVSWIALREDSSNPLYVKGYFRKNFKGNPTSKMARLKGYYFCQIVAIIQMLVIIIRIVYIAVASVELKK